MIGVIALAAAVFVAAFAITTSEAWWTIALVVFGVIVLAVERSTLPRRAALMTAAGLIGSIVLGAAGGWMVLLSQFSGARPCDSSCFDNGVLLVPGLVALVASIVLGLAGLRTVARAFGPITPAGSTHGGRDR
jgi:uncharacterized membrane protein YraQ (UPF0718 family)